MQKTARLSDKESAFELAFSENLMLANRRAGIVSSSGEGRNSWPQGVRLPQTNEARSVIVLYKNYFGLIRGDPDKIPEVVRSTAEETAKKILGSSSSAQVSMFTWDELKNYTVHVSVIYPYEGNQKAEELPIWGKKNDPIKEEQLVQGLQGILVASKAKWNKEEEDTVKVGRITWTGDFDINYNGVDVVGKKVRFNIEDLSGDRDDFIMEIRKSTNEFMLSIFGEQYQKAGLENSVGVSAVFPAKGDSGPFTVEFTCYVPIEPENKNRFWK